jgi:prephenate dehydratase
VIIPSSNSRVYTLGPKYSFSDILARKIYLEFEIYHLRTNSDLVEKASKGYTTLVPSENSVAGPVGETIRKVRETENVFINKEIYYPINQCLGGLGNSEEDIEIIYSHPKAIEQCINYLNKRDIKYKDAESTSEAAKTIKRYDKKSVGVICAREAIEEWGLNLLKENIQDNPSNYTVFWELSNKEKKIAHNEKIGTALIVDLENEPGALRRFLKPFDENGVNLYFINSWPENGEYWFLIKMEANKYRVPPIKIERICKKLRYLGSYNIIDFR